MSDNRPIGQDPLYDFADCPHALAAPSEPSPPISESAPAPQYGVRKCRDDHWHVTSYGEDDSRFPKMSFDEASDKAAELNAESVPAKGSGQEDAPISLYAERLLVQYQEALAGAIERGGDGSSEAVEIALRNHIGALEAKAAAPSESSPPPSDSAKMLVLNLCLAVASGKEENIRETKRAILDAFSALRKEIDEAREELTAARTIREAFRSEHARLGKTVARLRSELSKMKETALTPEEANFCAHGITPLPCPEGFVQAVATKLDRILRLRALV